jgi:hypothetical protein
MSSQRESTHFDSMEPARLVVDLADTVKIGRACFSPIVTNGTMTLECSPIVALVDQ